MDRPAPEIRIGDRERREVDARLSQAMADGVLTLAEYDERAARCWAARTRNELDALTADLPDPTPPEPTTAIALPSPAGPDQARTGALQRTGRAVAGAALLGAALFLAVPIVTADDGVSAFGSGVVEIAGDQESVEVGMLFGSVTVVVPDDMRARTSGAVVFGSIECEEACRPGPNQREVVVDGRGVFGSVNVVRRSELDRERELEELEERQEREEDNRDD